MSEVERVRAAADIVDTIGRYVTLKRCRSQQHRALCPFHQEKSPSFYVHPGKQLWHCHGCGAGGDVFTFVQRIEGCDFRRALQIVADHADVTIDSRPLTKEQRQQYAEQSGYRELLEHFRLRFGSSEELAPAHFRWSCAADPEFRAWLEDDLAHVHVITAIVVALLQRATLCEEAAA